jgi:basic amino acid/polyamine antiporter, APA family
VVGFIGYAVYRRRLGLSLSATRRAPALVLGPSLTIEYRTIVVPVVRSHESEEALVAAARLAAERAATVAVVHVLEVPLSLPLEADLGITETEADELLDDAVSLVEAYGVRAVARLARARTAGAQIVREAELRGAELIALGARRRHARGRTPIFGRTADYVIRSAPCRVLVAAGPRTKAA